MLVIPAFKACMQSALIRANIKPPVELVVANLATHKGSRENRLSFFYAYEQKGAPNHDKAKRENPRGVASRD